MLPFRIRPVPSASVTVSISWTCHNCRARSQRQHQQSQHTETKARRALANDADGIRDTRVVHRPAKSSVARKHASQWSCDVVSRPEQEVEEEMILLGDRAQLNGKSTFKRLADGQAQRAILEANLFTRRAHKEVTSAPGTSNTRRTLLRAWHTEHTLARHSYAQKPRMYSSAAAVMTSETSETPPFTFNIRRGSNAAKPKPKPDLDNPDGIRAELRKWQKLNGESAVPEEITIQDSVGEEGILNTFSRLPPEKDLPNPNAESDELEAMAHFMNTSAEDAGEDVRVAQYMAMGDLVEIESPTSDQASTVAVFIRKLEVGHKHGGDVSQFFTVHGRWLHCRDKSIMYSVPQFMPKDMIEPMLSFLPTSEDAQDLDALHEEARMTDLSVPRDLSAPLVRKLLAFSTEAKEIYRKHAQTFDNAHNILAHETDLRYGSLVTAACTLLGTTPNKLTQPALFAVRQALSHSGYAFNIDRRSHRKTGYLQIRSKEQVSMITIVRDWVRAWQDDKALTATFDEQKLRRHTPSSGARHVYGFVRKARRMVLSSREHRQPTTYGNVGPSSRKVAVTATSDLTEVKTTVEFTNEEASIVKFLEVWSLTSQFKGHARLSSLPPLILQATGLYDAEWPLIQRVGFQFLQEIGTVMPYENRVRFDQHLLLPSSQHSKPLQTLMTTIMEMGSEPKFHDSMAGLRKDWKDTPVYCIDSASAHEIDDGMSVESAGNDKDGNETKWIHVHIANPTAYFSRDHPLAKMARHMGETIYMPERTYMMLPRWAAQKYFSLANNRPCLTFSARVDYQGRTLEHKIESGIIRNVIRLTVDEVDGILGGTAGGESTRNITVTVGGDPPPPKPRTHALLTPQLQEQLRVLHSFAEQRTSLRRRQGGLFFDGSNAEVSVWSNRRSEGLGWDHPHRRGSRTVYGDPGIQAQFKPFSNVFSPSNVPANITVRESMLLACEIAAEWCAERQIPGVFRGSVLRPNETDSQARFMQEKLEPLWRSGQYAHGEFPMHLGMQYLRTFGGTHLATQPFKHRVLGMNAYGKVTSPLRRYGDMILHWQIEAVLREEARRGRSLITTDRSAPRDFLPFSRAVLDTIHVGLQPRELLISRAKSAASLHWIALLLMRTFHFNEAVLPLEQPDVTRIFLQATNSFLRSNWSLAPATGMEINMPVNIKQTLDGVNMGPFRQGDVWEVRLKEVDVWNKCMIAEPMRLIERVD